VADELGNGAGFGMTSGTLRVLDAESEAHLAFARELLANSGTR
jgi:hypothetical protein